jgi:hypothetical protein
MEKLMRQIILLAVLCCLGALPVSAATYFISPSGNDSSNGTSADVSWVSPKHSLNCGDIIIAASGSYSAASFGAGRWGAVTCPAGNNVAWLQCETFDTCKISSTTSDGMWLDASYWGVQGWEVTTSKYIYGACFHAGPSGGSTVHHIIFANDVANGCMGGGFNSYNASTSASVDYIVYVGNVAYNAAAGTGACYSGFNIYQPIASDTVAGTHMYIAGNYSYSNVDGVGCSGSHTTDGEGINLDTFDFSQGGGTAYIQQAVVQNNISAGNGSAGILIENNRVGSKSASVFFNYNTTYGNVQDNTLSFCSGLGDMYIQAANTVTATNNLSMTNGDTVCDSNAKYVFSVANGDVSDVVSGNWWYSNAGQNTFLYNSGSFVFGTNTTGVDPMFSSLGIPEAPACSGTANVPECMATLISNFAPMNTSAKAYGYQTVINASTTDPLFPQWLCNVNLPSGLVTLGCFQLHLTATVS